MNKESPILSFFTSVALILSLIFSYQAGGLWASVANGVLVIFPLAGVLLVVLTVALYLVGDYIPSQSDPTISYRQKIAKDAKEYKVVKNIWAFLIKIPLHVWLLKVMIEGGYVFGPVCLISFFILSFLFIPIMHRMIVQKENSSEEYEDTEE